MAETSNLTGSVAGDDPAAIDPATAFIELGNTGLRQYGGIIRDEFLRVLQGRQGMRTYREMSDNCASINALLFAIKQTLLKIKWRVDPADETKPSKDAAEYVETCRHDMSMSWQDFMDEVMSMLPYGYSVHEIVLKFRKGKNKDNLIQSSKFEDGLIGIANLAIRSQETVLKWDIGKHGEIQGVWQQPWFGTGVVRLPAEKILLFRTTKSKNNPEGRSILRGSYRSWFFLKRLEEIESVALERYGCGIQMARIPSAVIVGAANGDPKALAAYQYWQKLVANIRIDEQSGVVVPSDVDSVKGNKLYELSFLTTGGSRPVNFDTVISRKNVEIAQTVLADFIMLGHGDSTGTRALGFSKVEMFLQAMQHFISMIAAVLNDDLIPLLWEMNGFPDNTRPKFVPDISQRFDLQEMGFYISNLSGAGARMFPDDELENFLRSSAGLPELPEGEGIIMPVSTLEPLLEARLNEIMNLANGDPNGAGGTGENPEGDAADAADQQGQNGGPRTPEPPKAPAKARVP